MFEIEAEEILNKHCDCELLSECLEGIRTRCSDFEEQKKLLLEGIKFGYNKANEWHYVKDGDLPKIGKPCLVYLANGDVITARLREDNVWTTNGHNAFENVTAWKEIVLPELKEGE